MTFFPSACIWAYRSSLGEAMRQLKQTAFHYIDIEDDSLDKPETLQVQKELGLKISCVALDHKFPASCSLEGKDEGALRAAVDHIKKALEHSQALGASTAYVCSCSNRKHLNAFGSALAELARESANRGIRLCVEHVPGRALGTAAEALQFIERLNESGLYLLMDVGHALISKEKPWEIVAMAGKRLGYVQVDDNDGKTDRHWPLLDGCLTYSDLSKTLEALTLVGYQGTLGIELSPKLPSLISAFSKNRNLLLRLQAPADTKSLKEPETRRKH